MILSIGIIFSCRESPSYLSKGNTLYEAGKYDEAIINYKKAVQRDPSFAEGYYRLSLAEPRSGKFRDAYSALNSATTLLPRRADIKLTFIDLLLMSYVGSKERPAALYTQVTTLFRGLRREKVALRAAKRSALSA